MRSHNICRKRNLAWGAFLFIQMLFSFFSQFQSISIYVVTRSCCVTTWGEFSMGFLSPPSPSLSVSFSLILIFLCVWHQFSIKLPWSWGRAFFLFYCASVRLFDGGSCCLCIFITPLCHYVGLLTGSSIFTYQTFSVAPCPCPCQCPCRRLAVFGKFSKRWMIRDTWLPQVWFCQHGSDVKRTCVWNKNNRMTSCLCDLRWPWLISFWLCFTLISGHFSFFIARRFLLLIAFASQTAFWARVFIDSSTHLYKKVRQSARP